MGLALPTLQDDSPLRISAVIGTEHVPQCAPRVPEALRRPIDLVKNPAGMLLTVRHCPKAHQYIYGHIRAKALRTRDDQSGFRRKSLIFFLFSLDRS